MKKIVFLLTFLLAVALFSCGLSAETKTVSLRIEGTAVCLFDKDVPFADGLSLSDLLKTLSSEISFVGLEEGYITEICGEGAGMFGGWDGWMFEVNGVLSALSVSDTLLSDGDRITFFYGDPYGVGMQFPVLKTEALGGGKITFVSTDTVYDENWNPTVVENPVVGMTVRVGEKVFITDGNGQIDISSMDGGVYSVSYEKKAENGLPLVLRGDDSLTVTLPETASPSTSDGNVLFLLITLFALLSAAFAVKFRHE